MISEDFKKTWKFRRGEGASGSRGLPQRTFKRDINPEVREEMFLTDYKKSEILQ